MRTVQNCVLGLIGVAALLLGVSQQSFAQEVLVPEFRKLATGFKGIRQVRAHPEGGFWVLEGGKNRLVKVMPDGRRTDSLGKAGLGSYAFNDPRQIDPTNGMKLYVLDAGNERVQIFDRRNQFLTTVDRFQQGTRIDGLSPRAIAVDILGRLFLLDGRANTLYRFKPNGQPDVVLHISEPAASASEPVLAMAGDAVFLISKQSAFLYLLNSDGLSTGFRQLSAPAVDVFSTAEKVFVLTPKEISVWNGKATALFKVLLSGDIQPVSACVAGQTLIIADAGNLYISENFRF
jgi:hypothetical protein